MEGMTQYESVVAEPAHTWLEMLRVNIKTESFTWNGLLKNQICVDGNAHHHSQL